jgi:hypothetical protein
MMYCVSAITSKCDTVKGSETFVCANGQRKALRIVAERKGIPFKAGDTMVRDSDKNIWSASIHSTVEEWGKRKHLDSVINELDNHGLRLVLGHIDRGYDSILIDLLMEICSFLHPEVAKVLIKRKVEETALERFMRMSN